MKCPNDNATMQMCISAVNEMEFIHLNAVYMKSEWSQSYSENTHYVNPQTNCLWIK